MTLPTQRTLRPLPAAALKFCVAATLVLAAATAQAAPLDAVVAGPQRSDKDRARDAFRHPAQTLRLFALKPDQTVIEIAPGGGWYTDILAPYLHDAGKLYEAEYTSNDAQVAAEEAPMVTRYKKKLAQTPALYGNVTVGALRAGQFSGIGPDGSADTVVTFRNIHNWIKDGYLDANLRAFYRALKPGGVLGVEEHRAKPGATLQQMIDSGYVTEAYVIEHARTAGFELAERSDVNANVRDTKDHPNGVWSLPPTLQGGAKDQAKYLAIGESDRMTMRFVKPAKAD